MCDLNRATPRDGAHWLRVWRRRYCVVRTDFIVFAVDEEVRWVYGYDVLAVSVWL